MRFVLDANVALTFLDALSIETHHMAIDVGKVAELSVRYQLSGHDAVYFQLAKSLMLPVASFDRGTFSRHAVRTASNCSIRRTDTRHHPGPD